ncbi:MAG: spore coat protein CotH [Crocinitomicaceae bacterium]
MNPSDYLIADFEWRDSLGNSIWEQKGRIRIRGNRSAEFDKHSYSIKLNEAFALLDLPENKKWKLNAEYIDKTLMRNKLSYDLFRQFSDGNIAPEIQYCVVYINNDYNGIYALTESVDDNTLGLKKSNGAVLFKEPPVSHPPGEHEERFENFRGYIERSIRYKDYSIKAKYKMLDECYFNQRFPDIQEEDYTDEIYQITEFIFNSSDATFSKEANFNRYFDLDNLIDWHLLILVTANGDGTYKNFYMSKEDRNAPYLFTPWDYDHSFGRDGDGEPSKVSIIPVEKNMALLHRLMETNAFGYRQKLFQKFLDLKKKGVLTDSHIHKMIDANVMVLKSEAEANEKRWPPDKIDYFKNASFSTEIQKMKNWVTNHLPELEMYLKEQSERPDPVIQEPKIELPLLFPDLRMTSAVRMDTLDLVPEAKDTLESQ